MPFDFEAAVTAPFRMQPGLRRIPAGTPQLVPLVPGSRHQREKLAVLSAFWPEALCATEGFDPAPALDALCRHATAEHPRAWAWDGHRAVAPALGTAVAGGEVELLAAGSFGLGDEVARCLRGLPPPWRLAGLLGLAFAEDFAIVDAASGTIPWLSVALPSHWAPPGKVGRHFAEVHGPVADNAQLLQATAGLLRLMSGHAAGGGADRFERFVWTVTDHPRLHAHPTRTDAERWRGGLAGGAWFRSERQTFLPLPALHQAVFTIHVNLEPLADLAAAPGRAARLHAAIATMSPAVLAYRGLAPVRDELLAWLAERA